MAPTTNLSEPSGLSISTHVPATEFVRFPYLPFEIQSKIWVEHMKDPAAHAFIVRKHGYTSTWWDIGLGAVSKNRDTSAFRYWKGIMFLGGSSAEGVRRAIFPYDAVRLPRVGAAVRTGYDMIILDFERGCRFQQMDWFEHSKKANSKTMDMKMIRQDFSLIRKLGIRFRASFSRANGSKNPFTCYCRNEDAHARPTHIHFYYRMCPVEVASFLDCFKNLQAVYFVVLPCKKYEKDQANDYKARVLPNEFPSSFLLTNVGPEKREFLARHEIIEDLEMFRHSQKPIVEFHPMANELTRWRIPLAKEARVLAEMTRNEFTLGKDDEFYSSRKMRERVQFKVLLE